MKLGQVLIELCPNIVLYGKHGKPYRNLSRGMPEQQALNSVPVQSGGFLERDDRFDARGVINSPQQPARLTGCIYANTIQSLAGFAQCLG